MGFPLLSPVSLSSDHFVPKHNEDIINFLMILLRPTYNLYEADVKLIPTLEDFQVGDLVLEDSVDVLYRELSSVSDGGCFLIHPVRNVSLHHHSLLKWFCSRGDSPSCWFGDTSGRDFWDFCCFCCRSRRGPRLVDCSCCFVFCVVCSGWGTKATFLELEPRDLVDVEYLPLHTPLLHEGSPGLHKVMTVRKIVNSNIPHPD